MSLDIQMLENPIIRWIIEIGIKNSFGEILGLEGAEKPRQSNCRENKMSCI